ncbi:hypothetical protein OHA37_00080 [Streptomyces sp. NBC_00335]|uniref:hypothetical protein n=1 Tax=unclassified Streptomyces TaxID=2593676 RepID=UPI00224DDEC8|nr:MULTISPECIES: hypothetical protein [unclassified Streptomyces]MCX5410166.1 hypothetical protein [Streptomyces sp. NBC_00086]
MTDDRLGAASPARRTRRQKMTAWFSLHPIGIVLWGFLLLVVVLGVIVANTYHGTGEPCQGNVGACHPMPR